MLFLLGSFVAGGISLGRDRRERPLFLFVGCLAVLAAMYSGRFV